MVDDQADRSWDNVPVNEETATGGQADRGASAAHTESAAEQGSAPGASGGFGEGGSWSADPLAATSVEAERTARLPQETAPDSGWTAPPPPSPWARQESGSSAWTAPDPAAHVSPASSDQAGYGYGYPTQAYPPGYPGPGYPYPGQAPAYPPGYPGAGYSQPGYPGTAGYVQGGAPTGPGVPPNGAYPPAGYGGNPPNGGYPYYSGGYYPQPPYYQPNQPATRSRGRRWTAIVAAVAAFLMIATGAFWANGALQGAVDAPKVQQPAGQSGNGQQDQGSGQPGGRQGEKNTTASTKVTAAQAKGVVLIQGETSNGTAAGTGMILTSDGKVLTNYHVVAGTDKVAVRVPTTGNTYLATVLGFDQSKDVALLQLKDASGLDTVTVDNNGVSTGEPVTAVGNAEGGGVLVAAPGQVTGTDRSLRVSSDSPWGNFEDLSGLIQTNAGAVPGHSGGPMFDSQAEVVGITTAGSTKAGTSYAVPIATALSVVSQIETGADAGTVRVGPAGFLGVQPSTQEATGNGVDVVKVVSGSPAAKAGVTAGSRLIKVGDSSIKAGTNLASVIRSLEPGQQVTITWITSSGNTKTATVTLGSSPVN
ncbi:S1-C subfamily serine protease [Propionicimonas paludicola]|uniref:S1-C subfamily serine protease n=1 Tax=Propionicimonas paludicola TaxID=185243 RepID=A0A2A9CUD9_9ACTN|nr:trypsin-like peptidase domain-containing protein [Propionicimonas paludicola]PFG17751.1 S1-C subfamily serine protease [Propionicimonas paludicola]